MGSLDRTDEADATSQEELGPVAASKEPPPQDPSIKAILNYLDQRGYQMVSYERLRQRINLNLTDDALNAIVAANPTVFRCAVLKGDRPGLAKQTP